VAFKLSYLGKNYNGFEHHANHKTPLPTIEEELWKALTKARLIFPKGSHPLEPGEVNWEGTEYSKCGRTDKGVSAFGQVIGIRVRSNRPLGKRKEGDVAMTTGESGVQDENGTVDVEKKDYFNTLPREETLEVMAPPLAPSKSTIGYEAHEEVPLDDPETTESLNFDPINDEIPYCLLLNRLLPPDIRILAWCPFPPADFSARFSCKERQYKYFFTNPGFAPMPDNLEPDTSKKTQGKMKDGWLDIEAMKEAAKLFVGLHDFRNFCKVDPGKQITNFDRRIYSASIEEHIELKSGGQYVRDAGFWPEVEGKEPGEYSKGPRIYTFNLNGSAFLWHQVRHIVAILFLVGQRLEPPSVVTELLDTSKNPRRPIYEMATDTPLVLWNCVFPREDDPERKDALQWMYIGDGAGHGDAKYGTDGLMDNLWKVWRERKVDEMLASSLIDEVHFRNGADVTDLSIGRTKQNMSQKVFDGGDEPKLQGRYIPVMKKQLMGDVAATNEKYALKKGFKSAEDMKYQQYRKRHHLDDEDE